MSVRSFETGASQGGAPLSRGLQRSHWNRQCGRSMDMEDAMSQEQHDDQAAPRPEDQQVSPGQAEPLEGEVVPGEAGQGKTNAERLGETTISVARTPPTPSQVSPGSSGRGQRPSTTSSAPSTPRPTRTSSPRGPGSSSNSWAATWTGSSTRSTAASRNSVRRPRRRRPQDRAGRDAKA